MEKLKDYFEDDPRVRIVGYIYETVDYDLFKKMDGNREVDKINKLKTSMKKHGFLTIPVVINKDNEIGDGQHRFAAGSDLGLPIKFCVEPNIDLEETYDINNCQKNWSQSDKVHSQAALGNDDYKRFEELRNTFGKSFQVIFTAMGCGLTGGGFSSAIKHKTLTCSESQYEEAVKMLSWIGTFDDLAKKATGSKNSFYIAIMFARRQKGIDVGTLSKRIRDNFHIYDNHFGNVEQTVKKTEDVYNHKVPANNRVYFVDEYRKQAAESSARFKSKEKG